MACYSFSHGFRFGFVEPYEFSHGFRFTMGQPGEDETPLTFRHGFRFDLNPAYSFSTGFCFTLVPQETWDVYVVPTSSGLYRKDFGYEVIFHGENGDVDLTPWVTNGSIKQPISNAATFNLQLIDDEDRYLRPKQSPGDDLYRAFDGANFDDAWNINKWLEIKIHATGRTWESPYLLPSDAVWAINGEGEKTLTISGSDFTEILIQEDQQHEDYITTGDEEEGEDQGVAYVQVSNFILEDLSSKYGIRVRNNLPSFPIRQFSPKGMTALDYYKQLIYITQGQWYWDRDTLILEPLKWNKLGGAKWTFTDYLNIKNISYKMSISELKNEFVINKVEKGGSPLATVVVERYGITDFIELAHPSACIDVKILDANYGQVDTFTYYDAQQNPILSTAGPLRSGNIKAKYVRFIYRPVEDPGLPIQVAFAGQYANGRPPRAEVEFWGTRRAGGLGNLDLGYKILYRDENQTRYGRRRDRSPIENPLIPNKAYAERLAEKMAQVSERLTQISNWQGILNPWVMPGTTIAIECGMAGFESPTNFYVESVNKTFNSAGEFLMNLECSGDQA